MTRRDPTRLSELARALVAEGAEREALQSLGRAIEASRDARVEPARVAELSERLRSSLADGATRRGGLHAAGHASLSLSGRSGLTIAAALLAALSVLVALWLGARGPESSEAAHVRRHARQASVDAAPLQAASTSGAPETEQGEAERGRAAAAPAAARKPAHASAGASLARPDMQRLDSARSSASAPAAGAGQASKAASGAALHGHARAERAAQTATSAREGPAAELALLARSQAALERDARAALAVAEEHRQHYPRGVFTEEREMLAIEALQKLRRKPEAVARARAFVVRYPSSPHARRVRVLLDSAVGGGATHE